MKLSHLFLPHPDTHKKAHLLSWQALLAYIFLFIILQIGLKTYSNFSPGVLGINSQVTVKELIDLTNQERIKNGLQPVKENAQLDQAAQKKGENMFAENYWAHYSPSGKDPWGFITGAGYRFSYAGENLAKNFYTSSDVVNAWMASPTHRENLLNDKYQDIGMAVLQGQLNGEQTILVVQEFGTPAEYVAQKPDTSSATSTPIPTTDATSGSGQVLAEIPSQDTFSKSVSSQPQILVDPLAVTKTTGLSIIFFVALLLMIDFYILKRRGILRLSSRHMPHWALLGIAASALIHMGAGSIL